MEEFPKYANIPQKYRWQDNWFGLGEENGDGRKRKSSGENYVLSLEE
jgi:hypothetical protein